MRPQFTPAAERALAAAAGWTSCSDRRELGLPEVMMGLLAEPECRGALLLTPYEIDAAAVRDRFPALSPAQPTAAGSPSSFSPEWVACLTRVEALLVDYPQPLVLRTEDLLLALASTDNEISRWLAERGLDAGALEAEIHRLSGHTPGPLPMQTFDESDLLAPLRAPREESARPVAGHEQLGTLRIIDAAANRASEGLRVVEDYLRFALDDRHLTNLCKQLRHELAAALAVFPALERHAARETRGDVGTDISLPTEQARHGAAEVVAANFKRIEQSLRSLEEFSKVVSPDAAVALEQIRYRVYTLERVVDITRESLDRLHEARLYVLVDGCASPEAFRELINSLVSAQVSVIQLRDKRLADRELVARARQLRELTKESSTLFIMNDRPDLAVLCGADGVHVGQDELSVKDAQRILGSQGLVGVSTHSLEQARAAVLDGADYIGVGPTFNSGTKQFSQFTGTELLELVFAEIRLPAFAIGGITADNLPQVLAAGFTRVAVSGAVTAAGDPASAAAKLLSMLRGRAV